MQFQVLLFYLFLGQRDTRSWLLVEIHLLIYFVLYMNFRAVKTLGPEFYHRSVLADVPIVSHEKLANISAEASIIIHWQWFF